jgi:hypothetical protein
MDLPYAELELSFCVAVGVLGLRLSFNDYNAFWLAKLISVSGRAQ